MNYETSASSSCTKLPVCSQADYEKGLSALVGPPVANAAELEKAVKQEHER